MKSWIHPVESYLFVSIFRRIENLAGERTQETVTAVLRISACDHISDGTSDKSATVEDEGKRYQAGLIVVAAERPSHQSSHTTCSRIHVVGGNNRLPDGLLAFLADHARLGLVLGVE